MKIQAIAVQSIAPTAMNLEEKSMKKRAQKPKHEPIVFRCS